MSIVIEYPGGHSMLVDGGRPGHAGRGISAGGPADPDACYWANKLAGNHGVLPSIENVLGELECTVNQRGTLAITGAPVTVQLDGEQIPMWQGIQVHAGQSIRLGRVQRGLRTYIAIHGGIQASNILGSVSTVVREGLGGLHGDGKPLAKDDRLPLAEQAVGQACSLPKRYQPNFGNHTELAFIPCYQWQAFSRLMQNRFLSQEYTVQADSNRMGMRLSGLEVKSGEALVYSEGLALGAVQCPQMVSRL